MVQADFMKIPFPENTFDAVYAIEATCHAPDAVSSLLFFWRGALITYQYQKQTLLNPDMSIGSLFASFCAVWMLQRDL